MTGHILETAQPDRRQGLPDLLAACGAMQGAQPGEVLLGTEQPLDPRGMADPQQVIGQVATAAGEGLPPQVDGAAGGWPEACLLYTSPSPRDS